MRQISGIKFFLRRLRCSGCQGWNRRRRSGHWKRFEGWVVWRKRVVWRNWSMRWRRSRRRGSICWWFCIVFDEVFRGWFFPTFARWWWHKRTNFRYWPRWWSWGRRRQFQSEQRRDGRPRLRLRWRSTCRSRWRKVWDFLLGGFRVTLVLTRFGPSSHYVAATIPNFRPIRRLFLSGCCTNSFFLFSFVWEFIEALFAVRTGIQVRYLTFVDFSIWPILFHDVIGIKSKEV